MNEVEQCPDGMGEAGRSIWSAVQADYVLETHEERLLLELCRTADLLERLESEAAGSLTTAKGAMNPAVVELRQQRVVFARLSAALRIPLGATEASPHAAPRLQRRAGTRGVYSLGSAS
jgi:hypothetical protein